MSVQVIPNARWFDAVGTCRCGKPATGRLMSNINASLGPYCRSCADAVLKHTDKAERRS